MKIVDLFEAKPAEHTKYANTKTGFYGKWGAGCILMDQASKEFLVAFRSDSVEQPYEWGTWGGAAKIGDSNPLQVAIRELGEETGYHGPFIEWLPLHIYRNGTFAFYNFLGIVPKKFSPILNWENDDAAWVDLETLMEGRIPPHSDRPLHFGLKAIRNDPHSMEIIQKHSRKEISEGSLPVISVLG